MSTGPTSTSVRFGEEQLKRFGWKEGQGLGKKEQGITTHVRVSRKADNKGIGQGKTDFSFQWWDHLYNKSTAQIVIAAADDGSVAVSAKEKKAKAPAVDLGASYVLPDEDDPLAAMFVKATPAEAKQAKDEDDDEKKDYSMNLTDAELLAICEGRTAAKGARANTLGKILRSDGELGKKLLAIGSVAAETEASVPSLPQAKKRTRDEVEADDASPADLSSLDGSGDAKKRKKDKKEKKEKKAKKVKKGGKEEKKRSKKDKKDKVCDSTDEAPRKEKHKKESKA
ncbi:G patch domain-containing protein 4 [Allomyces arbusculus]|nr:G patch domain-containing protein 4 [Allomyces arbusculus]